MNMVLCSPEILLERIEDQCEKIGLNWLDVAEQAVMNSITYLNNFKKYKIPKFADLYMIANSIGYPFDDLVSENLYDPASDPDNILYWTRKRKCTLVPSSLLYSSPDKVAVARLFSVLAARDDLDMESNLLWKILMLEEVDLLFLLEHIFVRHTDDLFVSGELPLSAAALKKRLLPAYLSVWQPKNKITHSLWIHVNDAMEKQYRNKTCFLRDSGISTRAYKGFESGDKMGSSPVMETIVKVCNMLQLHSIDSLVRSEVPLPEGSYEFPELASELRTLPGLAALLDGLISFGRDELVYVNEILENINYLPFSDVSYITPKMRTDCRL